MSSGAQEEPDSLGIVTHSVTPPKDPKKEVFYDESRRAELRGLKESLHRIIEGEGSAGGAGYQGMSKEPPVLPSPQQGWHGLRFICQFPQNVNFDENARV